MSEIKQSLKTSIAEGVIGSFAPNSLDKMYIFTSKSLPWGSSGDTADSFVDSTNSYYDVWNNIMAAKRIISSDVLLMVNKNEWTTGTKYVAYNSLVDMKDTAFYVSNFENNVYKCISNNNSSESTDSPRGAKTESITTEDDYVWKFMFRIPEILQEYITDDYIPVRKLVIEEGVPLRHEDDNHLQYTAQYNAVDGAIEFINITNTSANNATYPHTVTEIISGSSTHTTIASGAGGATAALLGETSSFDDVYNGYAITIISGTGVGQTRKISDFVLSTRTITISEDWNTIPDDTSYYNISPYVDISGDGIDAIALPNMISSKIVAITITNVGSDYKRATATISTTKDSGTVAELSVMISPPGGHSSDPVDELLPDRIMIICTPDDEEENIFPVVNEFRQYGILKNPIINTGYTGEGEIAGYEVDTFTEIKITAEAGEVFGSGSFLYGDTMFGLESRSCGSVESWSRGSNFANGKLLLRNVSGKFKPSEKIIGVSNTEGDVWTSSSKPVGYVEFQDKTYIAQSNNTYRLSTVLGMAGGGSDLFLEDEIITGGSWGSTASVISYTDYGSTSELLVTGIHRNGTADIDGFSVGETCDGVSISTMKIPQFVEGTGTLLYINNVTPISHHNEQKEELRIIIDF